MIVGDIKPAVGQIAEARRKPEPQQVAEPEYVLGRATGIKKVLPIAKTSKLSDFILYNPENGGENSASSKALGKRASTLSL